MEEHLSKFCCILKLNIGFILGIHCDHRRPEIFQYRLDSLTVYSSDEFRLHSGSRNCASQIFSTDSAIYCHKAAREQESFLQHISCALCWEFVSASFQVWHRLLVMILQQHLDYW